ncbi:hypothetical protein LCGC14_0576530 [marine sediment metagenome]|uniref:Uncharacterized protein n=1 Tax=marine sediment metagenome TaxID=412755 RepID=A0A0F9RMN4_9ZZZZ|nr:MAG: hypothetical protein Lokiarch_01990 [Candidatus Lokiarchaeum sp. GC14_75]HEC37733.1 hypothetical protein [bacterium]
MEGEKKDKSDSLLDIKKCIINGIVDCFFEDDGMCSHKESNQDECPAKKYHYYIKLDSKKKNEKTDRNLN